MKSIPAAPGILDTAVSNTLVLEYGTEESLRIIEENFEDIAGILVEPVQSRRPEFRPESFWRELANLTKDSDTALIFDEVITGWRYHQGGIKESFGIDADIVTYGKVTGGGMPIGMIGGKAKYLDALDGGDWNFGDKSVPPAGVTYFAGTFVRHPLALAGANETLDQLKLKGPELQIALNEKADNLCQKLNDLFEEYKAPFYYANFGSLMKLKTKGDAPPLTELFCHVMRLEVVHIWDSFPTFLTTSHTDEDLLKIVEACKKSLERFKAGGIF